MATRLFSPVSRAYQAVQYDGGNAAAVAELAGLGNVSTAGEFFQVRTFDRSWVNVVPGWWVTRSGEHVIVFSGRAFPLLFQEQGT